MLEISLKRGVPIDFTAPLSNYIENVYQQDIAIFSDALLGLNELRGVCLSAVSAVETLSKLARYYGQVNRLTTRFPLGDDGIKLNFSWYNFGGPTSHDPHYDEAAILFNIGACYSGLAAQESSGSVEGLKRACNYFMQAAGVFEAVAIKYSALQLPAGTDLAEPVLKALVALMVAQAQECFVLKAILDKSVKDTTLAKIAMATAVMYESACSGSKNALLSNFTDVITAKISLYQATAHYRKSAEFLIASQYGREVVKLQEADEAIKRAKELIKHLPSELVGQINALTVAINKNLERATKDNSIIYHDPIPARGSWGDCGSAVVAKASPFPDVSLRSEMEREFLFERLPQLHVNKLINELIADRNALLTNQSKECDAVVTSIDELFTKLGLPGAVQAVAEPEGVPEGLQAKSLELQAVGGYVALEYSRDSVARLRSECIEMLSHCVSALNEEEQQDCIARQQYGAKWTRPLSSQLTVLLRKRLDELQSALNGSERNDAALAELFNVHIPMIISLCSPAHELAATIPNTGTSSDGLLSSSLLGEVTGAVVQREVFQERRNELIGKLDSAVNSVDLVDRLYALEGQPHDEIKKVLNDEFKAAIDPISSLFEQFKADVAEYEWRLEQLMLSFQTAQQHKQSSSQERQNILQSLDEAYNAFKTISAQLQAATTFYTSFLDQLHPLKNVCLDFASTRRNEYQSMMGTLASAPPAYGVSHPPPPPLHHHHYQQQQQQQQQTDPQRPNPYPSQHPSQYTQHPPPPPGPYPPQYPLQSHPNPHGGPPNHPPRGYQPQPGAWNPSMPVQYAPPANVSPASYGHYTGHPQAFSQPAAPMPYPYDGAPGASNASSIQQSSPNTHSLPHMPPTSPTLYPRQPPRPH